MEPLWLSYGDALFDRSYHIVVPLQLGKRDVAFPFLNALSLG